MTTPLLRGLPVRGVLCGSIATALLCGCAAWLSDLPAGYCPEGTQRESGGVCVPLSAAVARRLDSGPE